MFSTLLAAHPASPKIAPCDRPSSLNSTLGGNHTGLLTAPRKLDHDALALRCIPFFEKASARFLYFLRERMTLEMCAAGTVIFVEGCSGGDDSMFVLKRGEVHLISENGEVLSSKGV